ncbi:unnamed protein product, partial [marine sediment metagenome]
LTQISALLNLVSERTKARASPSWYQSVFTEEVLGKLVQ